jgi:glycosyltransferase involved in cell wall biosynthesis
MKITCIAPSRIPSATANSIQAMKACHALAEVGHQVQLIAPGKGPDGDDGEEKWAMLARQYGVQTRFHLRFLPPFDGYLARRIFPWRAGWRAYRLKPHVLYTWLLQSAVLGLVLGLPVVVELHDLPAGVFGRLWYRLFLRLPGKKRQLVITSALADALRRTFGPDLPETILAPNGVDLNRYAALPDPEEARRQLGMPARPTVACTGHLYDGRGGELFLDLAASMPDAQFLWVGGRPEDVQRWQERVSEVGLTNVTLTGFVPNAELPLYQAAADILLMPYQQDVAGSSGEAPVHFFSSMKMYEYMAARRPIISSDLAVIRETLDTRSALFCPPMKAQSWEQAIRHLLDSPADGERMAAHAYRQVQAFSWTARAQKALEGWA